MNNKYLESNQKFVQNDSDVDNSDISVAEAVQGASMTWDIMSGEGSPDQSSFGDFFPMQAAG